MPKSMREEVAALISLLALLEGVFFDTRDLRRLPYHRNLINRVLKSLLDSNVLMRIHDRRNYVLTDEFRETLKREVQRKTPRSGIHQFPSLDVFYVGGMEDWSEHEFETYVGEMKAMWRRLSQGRRLAVAAAALYTAYMELHLDESLDPKQRVTQGDIAEAAGISEVTLRNRLRTICYVVDKESAEGSRGSMKLSTER